MKIINSLSELSNIEDKSWKIGLTIGNFDGVHIGHRELLALIKKECAEKELKFVVLTFVPHPQKILLPENKSYLINSYKERRDLLNDLGIDFLVEIKFTKEFSALDPRAFLEQYIFSQGINIKKLFLGYDFSFGVNKKGDYDFVRAYCSKLNVEVSLQKEYKIDNIPVSSSIIRNCINNGKFEECNRLLGRDYFIKGLVVKSAGRGRQIGFPTANIKIDEDRIIPRTGVYITKSIHNNILYNSITNVGYNPTFETGNKIHIETNIFNFDLDIYDEYISVYFYKKIRDEKKFQSVAELINQIKEDISFSKKYFSSLD